MNPGVLVVALLLAAVPADADETRVAEAEARLSADRLGRLEAEFGLRAYELEARVDEAVRESDRAAIEAEGWDEARAAAGVETAARRYAAALSAVGAARREEAAAAEALKKEELRRQALRLSLVRLEAREAQEDRALYAENRRLLHRLLDLSEAEGEALEGIRAAWAARLEIARREAAAWRAHRSALQQALVSIRFRNLLSPTGAGRGRRVFAALALAAVLLLLARLRPLLPPLLCRLFPGPAESWRREVADAVTLAAGFVVVSTALAAVLGYTDLALYVLSKGILTLLGLGALAAADVALERSARRREAVHGVVAWSGRAGLLAAGVLLVVGVWDLPWRPAWEAVHDASGLLLLKALRIGLLVGALAVVLYVLRRVGTQVLRLAGRPGGRESAFERAQRVETLVGVYRGALGVVFGLLAAFVSLREAGIDITPLLAGAGIAGLAIGFGAQALVRDFLTGFFILMENQYTVGDVIRVGDLAGQVEKVGLRTTVLRDLAGTVHVIPNGEITKVSNMTHEWSRAVVDVGVSYAEDIDRVRDVLLDVGRSMRADPAWGGTILEDPEVLGVESFDESAVTIKMLAKTVPTKQWDVARELRRRIKRAFDAAGIEIPFPQRVVYQRTERPKAP